MDFRILGLTEMSKPFRGLKVENFGAFISLVGISGVFVAGAVFWIYETLLGELEKCGVLMVQGWGFSCFGLHTTGVSCVIRGWIFCFLLGFRFW